MITTEMHDVLKANGYLLAKEIDGKICALMPFAFTTGLVVDIDRIGYDRRYCYEHWRDAKAAFDAWDGQGHPTGPWIKVKGRFIDALNPNLQEIACP